MSASIRWTDRDVDVVDEDGLSVPTNTAGELVIRPRRPFIMFEHY
jgi:crotonobetaine/carnitine-CoA ligase